ncbi:MAG: 4Fe-4S cluster-binding domain-containing protein [Butyribacter sp.]
MLENDDIAGITISGGEPFLQYEELLYMIRKIKEMSNLDVMLFSGYELEELKRMYPDCMGFIKTCRYFC